MNVHTNLRNFPYGQDYENLLFDNKVEAVLFKCLCFKLSNTILTQYLAIFYWIVGSSGNLTNSFQAVEPTL